MQLLDWWSERLATDCLVAPERGYFVDQRWMDLAPGLIPRLAILRDEGYNVAYWNLPSREVTRDGERYTVNGRPLRFFHFSGYDPDHPDRLSKHQDRIDLGGPIPCCASSATATARRLAARGPRGLAHAALRLGTRSPTARRSTPPRAPPTARGSRRGCSTPARSSPSRARARS